MNGVEYENLYAVRKEGASRPARHNFQRKANDI